MEFSWGDSLRAYADAAEWFLSTVALVDTRWDAPALGEWDVRALVGHTSRAFLTVETYLARPASGVDVLSAADYYRRLKESGGAGDPAVTARGREAGAALGNDPGAALNGVARRVLQAVESTRGTELVTTIIGGMRLSEYLPTRTLELTVHTADLARALSAPLNPPETAARHTLYLIADLALAENQSGALLLGATGRVGLPEGFSVL